MGGLAGFVAGMLWYDRRNRPKRRAEIPAPDVSACDHMAATTDLEDVGEVEDTEAGAETDTLSFLGEPEPERLKVTAENKRKRKKRRR